MYTVTINTMRYKIRNMLCVKTTTCRQQFCHTVCVTIVRVRYNILQIEVDNRWQTKRLYWIHCVIDGKRPRTILRFLLCCCTITTFSCRNQPSSSASLLVTIVASCWRHVDKIELYSVHLFFRPTPNLLSCFHCGNNAKRNKTKLIGNQWNGCIIKRMLLVLFAHH